MGYTDTPHTNHSDNATAMRSAVLLHRMAMGLSLSMIVITLISPQAVSSADGHKRMPGLECAGYPDELTRKAREMIDAVKAYDGEPCGPQTCGSRFFSFFSPSCYKSCPIEEQAYCRLKTRMCTGLAGQPF